MTTASDHPAKSWYLVCPVPRQEDVAPTRLSLLRKDRSRLLVVDRDFIEIYIRCPIEICETRNSKGRYQRVRAGEVRDFTGISLLHDLLERTDPILDSGSGFPELCADRVIALLQKRGVIHTTEGKQA